MNKDKIRSTVVQQAAEHFKNGFCCSEAILKSIAENFASDVPQNIVCMATGLCGGMGNRRATCGVFTGGALALSLLAGRSCPEDSDKLIRTLSGKFQQQLEQEFGASICEDLLAKRRIQNFFKKSGCRKLVIRGTELLVDLILEYHLFDSGAVLVNDGGSAPAVSAYTSHKCVGH
jgi:C_GCAxxG_C_C family probable redox protein